MCDCLIHSGVVVDIFVHVFLQRLTPPVFGTMLLGARMCHCSNGRIVYDIVVILLTALVVIMGGQGNGPKA